MPQAADILRDCSSTTASLQSVHVALSVTNIANLAMQSVNADVTNQQQGNGQAVGDASVRLQPGAQFMSFQFMVTNQTMYTKDAEGKYTSRGPAQKIYDPGIVLDPDKGLPNVIKSVQNGKVDGRETINGVATVKVSGTVEGSVVDPVVPKLGEGAGALPITLWIADVPTAPATSTSFPSGTLPSGSRPPTTGANLVRMVINRDQGSAEITLSAWGKPVTIPTP